MATSCSQGVAEADEASEPPAPDDQPPFPEREFDFVERPSQDFFCPVSLDLLLEPQLTSCCGNHLSLEVATRLQREGKACPVCNGEQWSAVLDKYHRRNVHQVRVYCWFRDSGCGWAGEVNGLKRRAASCEKRPWECQYCGLKCTYWEGEEKHWPECTKFPEPCPNGCEVGRVERCGMEQHRMECLLEPVACEMKEFGCSVVVPRKELAMHMRESELQHLTAMTALNLRLTRQLQQDSVERDRKMEQLRHERDRKIDQLQQGVMALNAKVDEVAEELAEVKCNVQHIQGHTCLGCKVLEFKDYEIHKTEARLNGKDSYSDVFYSHQNGYALQLMVRYYGPPHNDIGAFLSTVKGDNDDQLRWPVIVSVTLELLNQAADHSHFKKQCKVLNWGKDERGTEREINQNLIKYANLEKGGDNVQYIVDDSFKFGISISVM